MFSQASELPEEEANFQAILNLIPKQPVDIDYNSEISLDRLTRLCEAIETSPHKHWLKFSSPAVTGPIGATMIANRLLSKDRLVRLGLSGQAIGEEGGVAIAQALTRNHSLQALDLSHNSLEFRPVGRALADALMINEGLQELDLSNNKFNQSMAINLARALKSGIKGPHSLRSLNLANNFLTGPGVDNFASVLRSSKSLQSLNLSNNRISNIGMESIGAALEENQYLQSLSLGDNDLTGDMVGPDDDAQYDPKHDKGLVRIFTALKKNSKLTELCIPNIQFGPNSITALAEALPVNSTLKTLDMRRNTFSREEGILFAKAVQDNTGICMLAMDGCKMDAVGYLLLEHAADQKRLSEAKRLAAEKKAAKRVVAARQAAELAKVHATSSAPSSSSSPSMTSSSLSASASTSPAIASEDQVLTSKVPMGTPAAVPSIHQPRIT